MSRERIVLEDQQSINEIKWLFKLPSKSTPEDFYHDTVHIEDGSMVSTDGNWIRIIKSPESSPGDYAVKKRNGGGYILIPKRNDRFYFFPPSWKRIGRPFADPIATDVFRDNVLWTLYGKGVRINIDYAFHLDYENYDIVLYKDAGIVVLLQGERQTTVLLTE